MARPRRALPCQPLGNGRLSEAVLKGTGASIPVGLVAQSALDAVQADRDAMRSKLSEACAQRARARRHAHMQKGRGGATRRRGGMNGGWRAEREEREEREQAGERRAQALAWVCAGECGLGWPPRGSREAQVASCGHATAFSA
jgi:hypothetical protein